MMKTTVDLSAVYRTLSGAASRILEGRCIYAIVTQLHRVGTLLFPRPETSTPLLATSPLGFDLCYPPKPHPPSLTRSNRQAAMSDDIWENGTVVRYMARVVAALLAVMTLYAFKEQLLGRETWDGKKIGGNSERKMDGKKNQ